VHSEFARLAHSDHRVESNFTSFLADAYRLKQTADYEVGEFPALTISEAQEAIDAAARILDSIESLLGE
jgi:hypothetical protein